MRAAWNVLSDPFQRQRYDARAVVRRGAGVATSSSSTTTTGTAAGDRPQLTGWRKLLAPPPPKASRRWQRQPQRQRKTPPGRTDRNGRPRPEPTVVLPAGMTIAEPRVRGMALLFDISILIVIFFAVSLVVPRSIQSDYQDVQDRDLQDVGPEGRARRASSMRRRTSTAPTPPARRRARSPT